MKRNTGLSSLSGYAAYIPVYENGDSVIIVKRDGETVVVGMGIKWVINALLKENSIDIRSLRRNFSGLVGKMNLIPVPLAVDRVLIPVKVRKAIGINDGAYGYVDLASIEEVCGDDMPSIRLKCGYEINCLETVRTVKNRMKIGDVVRDKFASRMMGQLNLKEGISAISSEYSSAATKGDLRLLAYEIIKLRKTVEWGGGSSSTDSKRSVSQKEEAGTIKLKNRGGGNSDKEKKEK